MPAARVAAAVAGADFASGSAADVGRDAEHPHAAAQTVGTTRPEKASLCRHRCCIQGSPGRGVAAVTVGVRPSHRAGGEAWAMPRAPLDAEAAGKAGYFRG